MTVTSIWGMSEMIDLNVLRCRAS